MVEIGHAEVAWFFRTPDWRYVHYSENDDELLFNMRRDPGETHNLAGDSPKILARMRQKLSEWRERVTAHYVPEAEVADGLR